MQIADSRPAVALIIKAGAYLRADQVSQIDRWLDVDGAAVTWTLPAKPSMGALPNVLTSSSRHVVGLALPGAGHTLNAVEFAAAANSLRAVTGGLAAVFAAHPPSASVQRAVLAEGATAVAVDLPMSQTARRLPSGIWQLPISWEIPQLTGWRTLLSKSPGRRLAELTAAAAVAVVDLDRASKSPRSWRGTERQLRQLAAHAGDRLRMTTLAEAAEILAARCTSRPQRSILRAA